MGFKTSYLVGAVLCTATLVSFVAGSPTTYADNFVCTAEEHRPRYHFSAKENWLNDPNGMVYYEGIYHLYYQYHPNSTEWGPMHWGHATSRNLAKWEELPVAIKPNDLGTIFSGSAVVDYTNTTGFKRPGGKDPIVAIYTSASGDDNVVQRQSIAYSLDEGLTFTQYSQNPVLTSTSPDFRDPKVFYHDGRWIMSLAVGNKIEFYASPDLKKWVRQTEFGRNPSQGSHAGVWECPDLIPFNVDVSDQLTIELWALIVSINPGGPNGGSATQYFIGELSANNTNQNLTFNTFPWSSNQWLDWGPDNYAGVTFSNEPKGRQVYIGWMSNWAYAGVTPNKVHRGQMTIPRQMGIRALNHTTKQYRLTSVPVPELTNLRHPHQAFTHTEPFSVERLIELNEYANFTSPTMELEINMEINHNPEFAICAHNDADEEVCFGFNSTHWFLDRSRSGNVEFDESFNSSSHAFARREIADNSTNIRIFLDVSSIEVFADGGLTTMTALFFPSKPFDKFYINHPSSLSTVIVKDYSIWGLQCWFAEPEEKSGSSVNTFSLIFVLANAIFALRQYFV